MSVAPGSRVRSFRALYIALIYVSLKINLACLLPNHAPDLGLLPHHPLASAFAFHIVHPGLAHILTFPDRNIKEHVC